MYFLEDIGTLRSSSNYFVRMLLGIKLLRAIKAAKSVGEVELSVLSGHIFLRCTSSFNAEEPARIKFSVFIPQCFFRW